MFRFSTQRVNVPAANSHFVPPGAAPDRIQISENVTNSSSNTPPLSVGGGDGHKNPPLEVVEEEEEEEEGVDEEKDNISYNSSTTGMFTPEPRSATQSYESARRLGQTIDTAERFVLGRLLDSPYSDLATTIESRRRSLERRRNFANVTNRTKPREEYRVRRVKNASTPARRSADFTEPKVYSQPSGNMRRDTLNLNSPIGSAPNFS